MIVEDIVDTGLTLTYLQDILRAYPKSLRTACLLSKPSRRQVDVRSNTSASRSRIGSPGYGLDSRAAPQPAAHRGMVTP